MIIQKKKKHGYVSMQGSGVAYVISDYHFNLYEMIPMKYIVYKWPTYLVLVVVNLYQIFAAKQQLNCYPKRSVFFLILHIVAVQLSHKNNTAF